MAQRFTAKAENALRAAMEVASSLGHTYLGSEHLLFGLATERGGVASRILEGGGANADKIKETISLFTGIGRQSSVGGADMTPRVRGIIEAAGSRAAGGTVGTEHLLEALLRADGCVARKVLSALGTDVGALLEDLSVLFDDGKKHEGKKRNGESKKPSSPLAEYGRDLSLLAEGGMLDPVIGREEETARLIRVLTRRTKNNPCLVGDPGVGKTAVVEGLALRIAEGAVPEILRSKKILSLDLSSLVAGAKYRGEFEERMRNMLELLRHDPNTILFIDEIHTIVGAGAAEGAIDAANILKPAMARGEIRVIGATTLEEYRRHIEKDAALERRFHPILIEAPSKEQTRAILVGLRERYEQHHGLRISDEAIEEAIELSVRYLPEHHLPDKALDLLDEAASELRLRHSLAAVEKERRSAAIRERERDKEEAVLSQDYERASLLRDEISQLLCEEERLKKEKEEAPLPLLTAELIAETVSDRTGIPVARLGADEAKRLESLPDELAARVIGQEEAIAAVCRAVRRARTGMRDARRPIGSFLFLGPTGVGKTELCRALAESFFGSERALVRFDMSEYMEKHALSRLIGSPPGYVGYEEEGLLSRRLRRRPYSLVLFDEIEKAHPDIFNLLLQILEDGSITDSHGRTVEFRHAIVIMTSNLGESADRHAPALGFADIDRSKSDSEAAFHELEQHFRPELINRIDEIVLFHRISRESLKKIAKRLLGEVVARIHEAGFLLEVDEGVASYLAEVGYSPRYGARELRRAVQHRFEDRFSSGVVEGSLQQGVPIVATASEDGIRFSVKKEDPAVPLA